MNPLTYPSKIDKLPVVLVAFTLLAVAGGAVAAFTDGTREGTIGGWISLASLVLVAGVLALLMWPVDYTLGDDALGIRTGILRWSIPYAEIRGIREENCWWSGPTLSYDRWRIDYEHAGQPRLVWVSPHDKAGFRAELCRRTGLPPGDHQPKT